MNNLIVSGKVKLNISETNTIAFLHDLHRITQYEPKSKSIRLMNAVHKNGFYTTEGRFLGFPWSGKFSYTLNEKGFHSEMIEGVLANKMRGGFIVNGDEKTCYITHYEEYQFPKWTRIINIILRQYLHHAMDKELRALSRMICIVEKIPEQKSFEHLSIKINNV